MACEQRFAAVPTKAIRDPEVGRAALQVLCELATYASRDGWCEPKQATMAEHLGISRENVNRHLRSLVALGYVEVRPQYRDDGGRRSNRYRVVLDYEPTDTGGVSPSDTGGVAESVTGGVAESVTARTHQQNTPTEHHSPLGESRVPRRFSRAERDAVFDALVVAFGEAKPRSRASWYSSVTTELLHIGATPEEVTARAAVLAGKGWRDAGPGALVKHWPELGPATPRDDRSIWQRQADAYAERQGQQVPVGP